MKHLFSSAKGDSISAIVPWMAKRSGGTGGIARRRHWTGAEKARLLAMLSESGLPVMAFSRKAGVPFSTLYLWRRQAEQGRKMPGAAGFAEVRIAGPSPRMTAWLHLPCGVRVEADVGTDPEWIAAIIKAAASA